MRKIINIPILLAFSCGLFSILFLSGIPGIHFDARVSLTESLNVFLTIVMGLYIAQVVQRNQSSKDFLVSYIVEQVSALEKKMYEIEDYFLKAKGRKLTELEKRYILAGFTFIKRSVYFLVQDSRELLGNDGECFLDKLSARSVTYWRETTAGSFPDEEIGSRVSSMLKREQMEFHRLLRSLVHKVNYS